MISIAFVLTLVLSATVFLGELSLDCDALSFLSAEPDVNGRGKMERVCVGLAIATLPFVEIAFTTVANAFAESCELGAFAVLTVVCEDVVVAVILGVLTGVVVGFATRDAPTNNAVVT